MSAIVKRNARIGRGLGLLALVWLGMSAVWAPSVSAQRFVDTSPRFAANTAAAGQSSLGQSGLVYSSWGGQNGFVPGFPVGYQVRLAGQNPNFAFSPYGMPRQYGAHDHGFRHVRQPGQAHFNQFGRNHWVATPIGWGCGPRPPICGGVPVFTGCHPWHGSPVVCYPVVCHPVFGNPWWGWGGGWGGWGWSGVWGGVSVTQSFGFGVGQVGGFGGGAWFGGAGLDPAGNHGLPDYLVSNLDVAAGTGSWAGGHFSDAWINGQAAVVMAQQAAVAQAEVQASERRVVEQSAKNAQHLTAQHPAAQSQVISDPLGNRPAAGLPTAEGGLGSSTKDGPSERSSNQVATEIRKESAAKRSAIEAREKRLAAQAEAERQRLLDTLRQR